MGQRPKLSRSSTLTCIQVSKTPRTLSLKKLIKRDNYYMYVRTSTSSFRTLFTATEQQKAVAATTHFLDSASASRSTATKRKLSEALDDEHKSERSTITAKILKHAPRRSMKMVNVQTALQETRIKRLPEQSFNSETAGKSQPFTTNSKNFLHAIWTCSRTIHC